jgi:SpoVK/Ycf46/Vps4 family AAA+-type ATPase
MAKQTLDDFKNEFEKLIRAKYALIGVESSEETRAITVMAQVAQKTKREFFVWSLTSGMSKLRERVLGDAAGESTIDDFEQIKPDGTPLPINERQPTYDPLEALSQIDGAASHGAGGIFVIKDLHKFIEAPPIQRKLRDLFANLKNTHKNIVLLSPTLKLPIDLQKSITILDLPLPDATELNEILCMGLTGLKNQIQDLQNEISSLKGQKDPSSKETIEKKKDQLTRVNKSRETMESQYKASKDRIIRAGLGLTADEFENVIAKCIVSSDLSIKVITAEKKQIIKKSGVCEFFETDETTASIGGLKRLKKYISSVSKRFSPKAKEFGIDPPRGVLMIGVPGGGKSLTAKACANEMQLPLLRLDMSQLVSKFYGESTNNMKSVWNLANTIAPCILWVDEIEKGLGTGNGGEMHEETARLFGAFLTEMEESIGVYVVATCNDERSLKAELMARFPRTFFVDIPTEKELPEIIEIHIRKVKRDPTEFDIPRIAEAAKGFVGREIRNAVQDALSDAFDEDNQLTTEYIVKQFKGKKSITVQKAHDIQRMRSWAKDNAEKASDVEPEKTIITPSSTTKGRFDGVLGLEDMIDQSPAPSEPKNK